MLYNVKMAQILQHGDQPFIGRGVLYIENYNLWSTKRAPAYIILNPQDQYMQVTTTINGLTYNYGGPFHPNGNMNDFVEIKIGDSIYNSDVMLDDVQGQLDENSPIVRMLTRAYPNLNKDLLIERAGYMIRPIGRFVMDQQSKIMLGHWLNEVRKMGGGLANTRVVN